MANTTPIEESNLAHIGSADDRALKKVRYVAGYIWILTAFVLGVCNAIISSLFIIYAIS